MENDNLHSIQARDQFVYSIRERHHELLLTYAQGLCLRYHYCISNADDAMQQYYLKVLHFYEEKKNGYEARGVRFLRVMVRNELLGMGRKRKSLARLGEIFHGALPKSADQHGWATDPYIQEFYDKIAPHLSDGDTQIMRLYAEGYSHEEIGQELGMNPSTAGVRIHRAKKTLAPHFEGWWRKKKPRIQ